MIEAWPHEVRVVLLGRRDRAYNRGYFSGLSDFANVAGWAMHVAAPAPGMLDHIRKIDPAGVVVEPDIFRVDDSYAMLQAIGRPVVAVGMDITTIGFPGVDADDAAVGRLAAQHLLDRGYDHFAVFSSGQHGWSATRGGSFAAAVASRGPCVEFTQATAGDTDNMLTWEAPLDDACDWLRGLPTPFGLLATNDAGALLVLQLCRRLGLRVPEDVAILGVDNDELTCELAHPPLSSVALPFRRMGFEAGRLLERMLKGQATPATMTRLPPDGVVTRQSTDTVAIRDADIVAALRFIREHHAEPIGMPDLLRAVPTYRHRLERGFRRHLGRTVMEEVRRVRVERAKRLLATTDLPVEEIAVRCGFAGASKFGIAFRKETGRTPTQHRRQARPAHREGGP